MVLAAGSTFTTIYLKVLCIVIGRQVMMGWYWRLSLGWRYSSWGGNIDGACPKWRPVLLGNYGLMRRRRCSVLFWRRNSNLWSVMAWGEWSWRLRDCRCHLPCFIVKGRPWFTRPCIALRAWSKRWYSHIFFVSRDHWCMIFHLLESWWGKTWASSSSLAQRFFLGEDSRLTWDIFRNFFLRSRDFLWDLILLFDKFSQIY